MNYTIKIQDSFSLENAPVGKLENNPWNKPYAPETEFRGVYVKDRGFLFRLTCKEQNPRITYFNPGDEVCEDSCLELFLNFDPSQGDSYINFEMNAGGAYLFGIGPDRYERKTLATEVMPEIKPEILKSSQRRPCIAISESFIRREENITTRLPAYALQYRMMRTIPRRITILLIFTSITLI